MRFVIDAASLINLRKLGWLNLLKYGENDFFCPEKVEQEIRRNKSKNNKILNLIKEKIITVQKVNHPIAFSHISDADAEAISLGIENKSTIISEDVLLRETANRYGVAAIDIAGLILVFYQESRIDQRDCLSRLKNLFEKKILSKFKYHQLLMVVRS